MTNQIARPRRRRSRVRAVSPLFLVPALLFYAFVTIVPSVRGALYAFTDWNGLRPDFAFVGLDNFVDLLDNDLAIAATLQTLAFAAIITVGQTVLGLLWAIGLTTAIRSRNVLRVIFFTPVVITPLVVAYLWKYIYSPFGPLEQLLDALGLGGLVVNWIGDPAWALVSVATVVIWQWSGLTMIIYIAGITGVDEDLLDAARVDGAGALQRFRYIVFPLLRPATVVVVILSLVDSLKLFDQVWVMTKGGPGTSTQTMTTALYQSAFTFGDVGTASAIAIVLTLLAVILSAAQYRLLRRGA